MDRKITGIRRRRAAGGILVAGLIVGVPATAALNITGTLQFSASSYSVGEGGGKVTITVTRTGTALRQTTVNYSTANGSAEAGRDYTAVQGALSWGFNDTKSKTFSVPVLQDTRAEGTEIFAVRLSAPANGAVLGTSSANVSIVDDDTGTPPPGTTLSLASASYATTEGASVVVTVNRGGGSSGAVSVHYATADGSALAGSDYAAASGTLNWAAGDAAPKSFSIPIADDSAQEAAESFSVALSAPAGATLATPASGTITIAANDPPDTPPPPPPTGLNPILFVTQVPVSTFLDVADAFGAQEGFVYKAPRGGDLMIRYGDGTLRNLTREAGYGMDGQQGANAIAVRQPSLHWSGSKALFSMVVGANTQQYSTNNAKWQIYEVTGLAQGQTASITKVAGQPPNYNNIAPNYASDGQIIFVSDRPRGGQAWLYPQRDEYESANVDTGLWKLDPVAQTYKQIEHTASGVTYPSVDSAGRIIFTKWDHLQRDQQADADAFSAASAYKYGAFNYDSEDQQTPPQTWTIQEFFPELRRAAYSKPYGNGYDGSSIDPSYPYNDFTFNHFFPWMLNQDGTGEETLNHVGRHELGGSYTEGSFRADHTLHYNNSAGTTNGATYFLAGDGGVFHLREDPLHAGLFYATRAPEFSTNTAGDIVKISGPVGTNPDSMKVDLVIPYSGNGRMRNPLPMSDGSLIVVHTPTEDVEHNTGTSTAPQYDYAFRLRATKLVNGKLVPDAYLTSGIQKTVTYWSPDESVTWSGNLWELDPVEVIARSKPPKTTEAALGAPEQQVFDQQGVDRMLLSNWMKSNNIALAISRNVTTRDHADQQQPFNLTVPGGVTTAPTSGATVYTVVRQQFFQGDQIRGYSPGKPPQQGGTPSAGRRLLAVPMHDPAAMAANPPLPGGAGAGSVAVAADGSTAAFVPARRAMTWQLVDASGQPIVRERNWISFAPGETRTCASCHGVNTRDQGGNGAPVNPPQALATLLTRWKSVVRNNCAATGGTGTWSYNNVAFSACDEGSQYRIQTCSGGNGCCDGLPQTQTQACP